MLTNVAVATALAASIVLGPPPTKVETVVDVMHGVEVRDDYRWLEALEAEDPSVERWTTLQNNQTRSVLEAIPGRRQLERRLESLMILPSVDAPSMRMNRYFYKQRVGAENQSVLYMRHGYDGAARALLNPNTMDADGLVSLDWYEPNHDGTLLAFGLSYAGDENYTLYVLEVDTDTADILLSSLGASLRRDYRSGGGTYTPELRAAYLYDFIGDEFQSTSTFTGGGAAFDTNGADVAQHSASVGFGLTYEYEDARFSISADYDAEVKADFVGQSASLTARLRF